MSIGYLSVIFFLISAFFRFFPTSSIGLSVLCINSKVFRAVINTSLVNVCRGVSVLVCSVPVFVSVSVLQCFLDYPFLDYPVLDYLVVFWGIFENHLFLFLSAEGKFVFNMAKERPQNSSPSFKTSHA